MTNLEAYKIWRSFHDFFNENRILWKPLSESLKEYREYFCKLKGYSGKEFIKIEKKAYRYMDYRKQSKY